MSEQADQLYNLLPAVYRQRDVEQGYPLRDLLRVIAEQVAIVGEDITQLYENWFVETCQDWVVPYIGDLVGYRPVHEAGEPGGVSTPQERRRNKILIPRREVANTIYYRRRKGSLHLLEILAEQVAGWPARAVEFYKLLGWTQSLNHLRMEQGRSVDVRQGDALDRLGGPFDELAHHVDVRRIDSSFAPGGRTNIPSVGLFVWRLKAYPVTQGQACCLEDVLEAGLHCFTFSYLGNDCPLYARPQPEPDPTHIATEDNLPAPIRRHAFDTDAGRFYGPGKSIQIWRNSKDEAGLVPLEQIIPANLAGWHYEPSGDAVAVDPVLGRMAFNSYSAPEQVWVSYYYGFSADVGGGEYERPLDPVEPSTQSTPPIFYRVTAPQTPDERPIQRTLDAWQAVKAEHPHAVIELMDSGEYPELLDIKLEQGQSLQIRAANRTRPLLYRPELSKGRADYLKVSGKGGGRLTLDGLLITGRGIRVKGELDEVTIRHCCLVPGLRLFPPTWTTRRPTVGPSLHLDQTSARLTIEHSIVGAIQVDQDEVRTEPMPIAISDSILDATGFKASALIGEKGVGAHALVTIARSTVIGHVRTHAIQLAEDCIFHGHVLVARRQLGCMRFCYAPPDSRTPRRYHCQPDLAARDAGQAVIADRQKVLKRKLTQDELKTLKPDIKLAEEQATERVQPQFNSTHYGTPTYCQLADTCPPEITRGASDQSEMGVFHDLYQPQRAANLRARLDEYVPAGMDAGLIYAS